MLFVLSEWLCISAGSIVPSSSARVVPADSYVTYGGGSDFESESSTASLWGFGFLRRKITAAMMASITRTANVIPTPNPAFAPDDMPDDSDDAGAAVGIEVEDDEVEVTAAVEVLEAWLLPDDDAVELLADEVVSWGSTATAVPALTGASALNTKSSSVQQLVLRPVTPASSVPCGVQQNSFFGTKQ
jgi:hypothetical protein